MEKMQLNLKKKLIVKEVRQYKEVAKKTETKEVLERIWDYTLEDIMGERFGSYSKYIIQERAIPDARDGLKPVQRRTLYSMYID